MKKLTEVYMEPITGIQFEVNYCDDTERENKRVTIHSSGNDFRAEKGFVFKGSRIETVIKIGKALLEIGEFCEKL